MCVLLILLLLLLLLSTHNSKLCIPPPSHTPTCHRSTDHKAKPAKGDPSPSQADAPAPAADSNQDTSEDYIVMVCHQNVIRYFACRALQLPPEAWLRFRGNNCGVTEIIVSDDGRASLDKFADVGHLPLHMHTFH